MKGLWPDAKDHSIFKPKTTSAMVSDLTSLSHGGCNMYSRTYNFAAVDSDGPQNS